MTDSDPTGHVHGHRTLAAILFTDVVGYSARVQEDEEHTLQLVQRDLDFMTATCAGAGGQVLKSTGDGLLMFFTSAVEAVKCALTIQKHFAQMTETAPPRDVLQHRIGIHLGDVFVDGSDVMGDGVNIAARIQAEAEPGGICVSQTVYDVVKNRIGVQTTYLGPRELKNIREAVPVYRVLLAAQDGLEGQAGPAAGRRTLLWMGGAALLAVAAVAAVLVWIAVRPGGEPARRPQAPLAPPSRPAAAAPTEATVEIAAMPATEAELDRLYSKLGKTPEGAAAAFITAAAVLETEPALAQKCILKILGRKYKGPSGGPTSSLRFFLERLLGQPRIARSYFVGTTAAKGYQLPPPPYRIAFTRNPGNETAPARVKIFVVSTGGGSARPVVLRRTSEGLWRVEEMSSLALGVRGP